MEMFILSQDGPYAPDCVHEGALVMMRLPKVKQRATKSRVLQTSQFQEIWMWTSRVPALLQSLRSTFGAYSTTELGKSS